MYMDSNFSEISIISSIVLAPNRRETIVWTITIRFTRAFKMRYLATISKGVIMLGMHCSFVPFHCWLAPFATLPAHSRSFPTHTWQFDNIQYRYNFLITLPGTFGFE